MITRGKDGKPEYYANMIVLMLGLPYYPSEDEFRFMEDSLAFRQNIVKRRPHLARLFRRNASL